MDLRRVLAGLLPLIIAFLLCKLIDDCTSFSFSRFYAYVVIPLAASGIILYLLDVLVTTHPYEGTHDESNNVTTVNMDPTDAAIRSGPSRHQNDAAVDEVEMLPLDEAPPEVDRTIPPLLVLLQMESKPQNDTDQGVNSNALDNHPDAAVNDDDAKPPLPDASLERLRNTSPGTRTDILEEELITHRNDKDQGYNSVPIDSDIDPNAPGLHRGLRRHQHNATNNNALEESPPEFGRTRSFLTAASRTAIWQRKNFKTHPNEVNQGSTGDAIDDDPDAHTLQRGHQDDAADTNALPALEGFEMDLEYDFQCGVCKLVFDSRSEVNLIRHQKTNGHHYCSKCDRNFRSCGALLQQLEASDSHNFRSNCVEDILSPSALQTHMHFGSWAHRSIWTCSYQEVVLGIAVLILVLLVAAFMLALGVAVPVVLLGIPAQILVLVLGILARVPMLAWYVFLFLCWASWHMSGFWPCTYSRGDGRVLH